MSQVPGPGQGPGEHAPPPDEMPTARVPSLDTVSGDAAPGEAAVPLTFGPTVTIFFSDIRGFTEYTEAHGDAAAYRMLQHHNAMVQEQIALYGGHIVKTLGDSYMVSFDAARNAMTYARSPEALGSIHSMYGGCRRRPGSPGVDHAAAPRPPLRARRRGHLGDGARRLGPGGRGHDQNVGFCPLIGGS